MSHSSSARGRQIAADGRQARGNVVRDFQLTFVAVTSIVAIDVEIYGKARELQSVLMMDEDVVGYDGWFAGSSR